MMKRACSSELALRERRGGLGGAERLALDAHLAACESCRLTFELGRIFDAPDAPELDDGARIQRLARAAATWTRRGRRPRGFRRARALQTRVFLLVAACVVLCGGIAAAAFGTRPWLHVEAVFSSPTQAPGPVPEPRAARPRRTFATADEHLATPGPVAAAPTSTDDIALAPSGEPVSAPASKARHTIAASNEPAESAAAIFRAANDARRSGDNIAAMTFYEKLEHQFSNSPEAQLSAVPLGEMLLAANHPKAALDQFDRASGTLGGTFRPEALYGRARSLAALGDGGGEKRAWQQLLEEFPKCPYAEAARRRLEAAPQPGASGSP